MTIQAPRGTFAPSNSPVVFYVPLDRSHSVLQAPSHLGIGRPAQSKAGQS